VGIPFYIWARSANRERAFTGAELLTALVLVGAAVVAAYLMWTGVISAL
jgi:arginine:ornithine antiporter/lysine permease